MDILLCIFGFLTKNLWRTIERLTFLSLFLIIDLVNQLIIALSPIKLIGKICYFFHFYKIYYFIVIKLNSDNSDNSDDLCFSVKIRFILQNALSMQLSLIIIG